MATITTLQQGEIGKIFEKVFGEDIFTGARTRERSAKRTAAYAYMREVMGMTHMEIGAEVGRNQSTVGLGAKRFLGLLESGDAEAENIWMTICAHRMWMEIEIMP